MTTTDTTTERSTTMNTDQRIQHLLENIDRDLDRLAAVGDAERYAAKCHQEAGWYVGWHMAARQARASDIRADMARLTDAINDR